MFNGSLSKLLNHTGPAISLTILLHVFPASIAKHLWGEWCCRHPVAIDHDLHVLVHWIGPVHVLHKESLYEISILYFTWDFTFKSTPNDTLMHHMRTAMVCAMLQTCTFEDREPLSIFSKPRASTQSARPKRNTGKENMWRPVVLSQSGSHSIFCGIHSTGILKEDLKYCLQIQF